jgi:two-component system, response regulator YesN
MPVLRLIIIDDEKLIREGLVNYIDWASLGIEVVKTYAGAMAAMQGLDSVCPDIILSDIRMQEMDGIEMLKSIKAAGYSCEVVFISAYRDFDYAKEAIKYGAFEYLLKPIEEVVLLETMKRCVDKVNASNQRHWAEEGQKAGKQKELVIQALFSHMSGAEWALAAQKLGMAADKGATLAIVRLGGEDVGGLAEDQALHICRSVGLFQENHEFIAVSLTDSEVLIYAFGSARPAVAIPSGELNERLSRLGLPAIVGYDSSAEDGNPKRLFDRASWAALGRELESGFNIGCMEDLRSFAIRQRRPLPKDVDFIAAVKSADAAKAHLLLKDFFIHLAASDIAFDADMVRLEIYKLFDAVFHHIREYPCKDRAENPDTRTGLRQILSPLRSIPPIYTAAQQVLSAEVSLFAAQQESSTQRIVGAVVDMLRSDLSTDVTLENVARKLFVNPNYLSRIFAAEMSESFSHYRTRARIEMAKELLLNTKYKVYEIASMVGYGDVAHFIKVFSSFEGVPPSEYRGAKA